MILLPKWPKCLMFVNNLSVSLTYDFNIDDKAVKVEIGERDNSSLLHAIDALKDYFKLTVEVKLQPSAAEFSIDDGKRALRTKEVNSEPQRDRATC